MDQELEKFQVFRIGPCVPVVADAIASDFGSGDIGVFFLWEHLADNGGEYDLLKLVMWDVGKQDYMEGVITR